MTEEQIKQNAEAYAKKIYPYTVGKAAAIMDFIAGAHSRDEEIEDLGKSYHYMFLVLANKVEQLRNPWISVEEQLPNPEDIVFFRLPKGRPYVGSYFTKDKLFMNIEGCYFVKEVTHWMPIPELKKGE